jgi:hypothetical protein
VALLRTLRKVKKSISGYSHSIKSWIYSKKWIYTESNNSSSVQLIAHVLVIKNDVYCKVAVTCIESFLHFNPKCKVIVHCDSSTIMKTENLLQSASKKREIEIRQIIENENQLWQITKLELILSMNGSNDVFMDADLRWNGPLNKLNVFTYFVREFDMEKKSPFRELIKYGFEEIFPDTYMKNVSFITFAGQSLPANALSILRDKCKEYLKLVESNIVGALDVSIMARMVEQVILSLFIPKYLKEFAYLKDTDQIMDGRFVESSYFGATGAKF